MPHGRPDWLLGSGRRTTYRWAEFDELAVRLGSPVSFDRRGDVVFWESFEDGLRFWIVNRDHEDSNSELSVSYPRTGGFGVRMTARGAVNAWTAIARQMALPIFSNIGFEVSFTLPAADAIFMLTLYAIKDPSSSSFKVRYRQSTQTLEYWDHTPDWAPIASNLRLYARDWAHHTMKLVVDSAAGEYLRVILDDEHYDLSGIAARVAPDGVPNYFQCYVQLANDGTTERRLWVDDFILTQNE